MSGSPPLRDADEARDELLDAHLEWCLARGAAMAPGSRRVITGPWGRWLGLAASVAATVAAAWWWAGPASTGATHQQGVDVDLISADATLDRSSAIWHHTAGRIAYRVEPRNTSRPFQVATPHAIITVTGTRFSLAVGAETRVVLSEGSVSIATSTSKTALTAPAQARFASLTASPAAAPWWWTPADGDRAGWLVPAILADGPLASSKPQTVVSAADETGFQTALPMGTGVTIEAVVELEAADPQGECIIAEVNARRNAGLDLLQLRLPVALLAGTGPRHTALSWDGDRLRILLDGLVVSERPAPLTQIEWNGPLLLKLLPPVGGDTGFSIRYHSLGLWDRSLAVPQLAERSLLATGMARSAD